MYALNKDSQLVKKLDELALASDIEFAKNAVKHVLLVRH